MTDIPWKVGETYRTADGTEVRIYATDGGGVYPIHGAWKTSCGWEATQWNNQGKNWGQNRLNLLPPPKPRVQGWVNVYPGPKVYGLHISQDAANRVASDFVPTRLACIYIDVEEGQGL